MTSPRPSALLLLTLTIGAWLSSAFVPTTATASPVVPSSVPSPPPGVGAKSRLSDEDFAKKKEDGYFTGLPLANFDPNTGIGAGARVYYYDNGARDAPLFAYAPYRHRVFLQGFASTGGLQFHWIDYDGPNLDDTPFRARAAFIYERNTARTYFGIGKRTLAPLSLPDGRSFSTFAAYDDAARRVAPDGTTLARYDKLFFERPLLLMSLERTFFGGVVRPLAGVAFSHARIKDSTGDLVGAADANGNATSAPSARTRLGGDCDAGQIKGCLGGWDNILRLGLSFDTRDFEPDPNSGVFVDAALDIGTPALGSQFSYARAMLAARAYVSPFPRVADLVIAGRAVYQVQSQGTPFFSMDILPFTEDTRIGLGGVRTLRGFKQDRFVGHVMALGNLELRYTFFEVVTLGQRFAFIAVPFVDMGRVYDAVRETTLAGMKRSQGGGLRIAWNLATLIMVDYGFSTEDSGLYINFNHIF